MTDLLELSIVSPEPGASAQQAAYRDLFRSHIDEKTLTEIRHATQKGWVLGNDRFKDEIEHLLKRHARPLMRGGDHRSIEFQKRRS